MTLKLYTLRGTVTGTFYYATAHTKNEAARKLGIKPKLLIIERTQTCSPTDVQLVQDPSIPSHTAQYHSPRK